MANMRRDITTRETLISLASLTLIAAIWFGLPGSVQAVAAEAPPQQPPAPRDAPVTPARELVASYCVSCHNAQLMTGGLDLDAADAEDVYNSAQVWEKVIVNLRSRAMPPSTVTRRPDASTYNAVAEWLEDELDRAALTHVNPGRGSPLHRLNRVEYANAVRDLVGVEIDATALLPPDRQAFGFDTNGDALTMQPALLERYLTAAVKISRMANGDPTIQPAFERYTAVKGNPNEQTSLAQTDRLGEEFPLGSRGGIAASHYFPADGEYVIRLRLQRTYADVIRGLDKPTEFQIRVDGVKVGEFALGGAELAAQVNADYREQSADFLTTADDALEARVGIKAGLHQVIATILKTDDVEPEGLGPDRIPSWSRQSDVPSVPASVSSMLIGGPYNAEVPEDSPSRRLIYVCQPASATEETACATQILSTLARRAYRRAATPDDVEALMAFYTAGRAGGGDFDAGIGSALERVLASPDFLYRIEADPATAAPGEPYRVSDVELASRLSFFLWSSIPDDELLDVAIDGRLSDTGVLEQQVRRMLADPRARTSLVGNFFEQWLQTRNLRLLTPENTKFPWFDDNLRLAMMEELNLFFDSQLADDRSIVDLLTSDETYLNERLATHYDIEGVYGSHFRAVKLTDRNRFGLLGKGGVLAVTSYTTRTSPTIRGKYLLDNILGAPVPPPPPDIPALETSNPENTPMSVRRMLEMHRTNPVCASCHARMDPLGLSLENFDAIGQWRTTDAGTPIDASGVLLDGTRVDGVGALRDALVGQETQFVTTVVEKLATYALGREIQYYDRPAIRGIVRAGAVDDYRWSSVIIALTKSTPFQMRRAGS